VISISVPNLLLPSFCVESCLLASCGYICICSTRNSKSQYGPWFETNNRNLSPEPASTFAHQLLVVSFEANNGIEYRNDITGEREAEGKHRDHLVLNYTHRSAHADLRQDIPFFNIILSYSSSTLRTFKAPLSLVPLSSPHQADIWGVSKVQETQIVASYLATWQADAASHWSEVGCMRFHRIAHRFFPISTPRTKRLAKCEPVRFIVAWKGGQSRAAERSLRTFVSNSFVNELGLEIV